jgi:hypothetical protein
VSNDPVIKLFKIQSILILYVLSGLFVDLGLMEDAQSELFHQLMNVHGPDVVKGFPVFQTN